MQRVWTSAKETCEQGQPPDRMMWDIGSEFWETIDYEKITHYKVLSRESVVGGIIEILEELPECPIPAEAIPKKISGWTIKCKIQSRAAVKDLPQREYVASSPLRGVRPQAGLLEAPPLQAQQTHTKEKGKPKEKERPKGSQPKSEDIDTSEREANKRDLWTSLSQWIPPSALYQASLHEEFLELLEQTQPSQVKKHKHRPSQRPLSL